VPDAPEIDSDDDFSDWEQDAKKDNLKGKRERCFSGRSS
jgi:DNA excision repair protein ERCC-3